MSDENPNFLLVILDSVRSNNMSLYGYNRKTTPFLDRWAKENATVYNNAKSPSIWSLPSHVSMFTGKHVEEHKVENENHSIDENEIIYKELSKKHNYETAVFSDNPWITLMDVGIKEAFDQVSDKKDIKYPEALDPQEFLLEEGRKKYIKYIKSCLEHKNTMKSLYNGIYSKLIYDTPNWLLNTNKAYSTGFQHIEEFKNWHQKRNKQWAACINLMDAHHLYEPEEQFNKWGDKRLKKIQSENEEKWDYISGEAPEWKQKILENLYDGCILQLDSVIEELVNYLKNSNEFENTHIVITSDHGETFCEDPELPEDEISVGHGFGLSENLFDVPLIVKDTEKKTGNIQRLANIQRYPEVIKSRLEDNSQDKMFHEKQKNNKITTKCGFIGMASQQVRLALENITEEKLAKLNGLGRVVYVQDSNGKIVKHMAWRNREEDDFKYKKIIIKCPDDSTSTEKITEEEYNDIEDKNIRSSSKKDLDDNVQERLEDLGYA
jgi:arylsulfatase A-like enzyme